MLLDRSLPPGGLRAENDSPCQPGGISWQVTTPNDGVSLRVARPDGTVFERKFVSGESPALTSPSGVLPDGSYTYAAPSPVISPEARAQAKAVNADGNELAGPSRLVQSGGFRVLGGVVQLPGASGRGAPVRIQTLRASPTLTIFSTLRAKRSELILTTTGRAAAPIQTEIGKSE